jgi:UDP-2-acetamido-3-amino-2,3-dideoxy-glucuronate N-acetyltransferase
MVFTNVEWPRAAFPRTQDLYRKTLVKRGASIGANATIVCGVVLGRFSFVGAGSVVTEDLPDYALAYGVPARVHGWVCVCGEKLEFAEATACCGVCSRSYRKTMIGREARVEESAE